MAEGGGNEHIHSRIEDLEKEKEELEKSYSDLLVKYDELEQDNDELHEKCRSLEYLCSANDIDVGKILGSFGMTTQNVNQKDKDGQSGKKSDPPGRLVAGFKDSGDSYGGIKGIVSDKR